MTHLPPPSPPPSAADAGRQVAHLRHVLRLVRELAGLDRTAEDGGMALADEARLSAAYAAAPPLIQRRFDAMVAETAAWAARGIEALITADQNGMAPSSAAEPLATALADAIRRIEALPYPPAMEGRRAIP